MWEIAKEFDFCYGHRVHNQSLNAEYSLDNACVCRHLHGHQGKILVYLQEDQLVNGMVTDFKHLNWFKKFLDSTLDHKFIMDINDPLFDHEVTKPLGIGRDSFLASNGIVWNDIEKYGIIDEVWYSGQPSYVREKYEGMVFVEFVPTSENLSKWLLEIVQSKMLPLGIKVSRIQFFETPKSQSNYYGVPNSF